MFTASVKHASPYLSTQLPGLWTTILPDMDTGERIKQVRAHLGLSQAELGALAGVSKSAVSQWERGLTLPERDALMALQRARMISAEWVMHGRGNMFERDQLVDEEPDLTRSWRLLTQEEQSELLAVIKKKAEHNRSVMEQLAPYGVEKRTVNVAERRRAEAAKNLPFPDRRKKNVA